jgi:hypothetical protein
MYAIGCKTGTSGQLSLLQNGNQIATVSADDGIGFGYIYQQLQAGTYQIRVSGIRYASDAVRDYTVGVYA